MFVVSLSYSERAVALAENKLLVKPRFLTVGFDLLVIITIAFGSISFSLEVTGIGSVDELSPEVVVVPWVVFDAPNNNKDLVKESSFFFEQDSKVIAINKLIIIFFIFSS
jgi:hydrogenase-4 membrane subunit HyfE